MVAKLIQVGFGLIFPIGFKIFVDLVRLNLSARHGLFFKRI